MFRKVLPLTVLIGIIAGCSKKEDAPVGGDGGDSGGPNATYTIKVREEQKGDKYHVVKSRSGTTTTTAGGKSVPAKEQERYEYTETILEMPPDAAKPTKVTRAYKTAQRTDARGELKTLSFAGKTVTIEKKGKAYSYTADGKPVPPSEAVDFRNEFEKADKTKFEDMLPSKPVKIGEPWDVDFAKIAALTGPVPFTLDKAKSKITGTLRRVYARDGGQWGTIELRIVMVIAPGGKKGPPLTGTINSTGTIDTPIDGSAHAGTMKMVMNGTITATDPKAGEIRVVIDGSQELTGTSVK